MAHRRWNTRFASWVREVTVRGVVERLAEAGRPVTENAVYNWVEGHRSPRLETAVTLQKISGGRVAVEDLVK